MSHGSLPTITILRGGVPVVINVMDYDPERDELPGPVDAVSPTPGSVPVDSVESVPLVTIPENWESLGWPQLRSLSASVSDTPIHGRNDAVAAIKAHLEKV